MAVTEWGSPGEPVKQVESDYSEMTLLDPDKTGGGAPSPTQGRGYPRS